MKKLQLVFFALVVATTSAIGSAASTCVSGDPLSDYLAAGYSCDIGNLVFSNFTYSDSASGGATALPASGIDVVTVGTPGSGAALLGASDGFDFTGGWSATSGQTLDSDIGYDVSAIGGATSITDSAIAQLSSGVIGTGTVGVSEGGCSPAPCLTDQWGILTFNSSDRSLVQLGNFTFVVPTGSLEVDKDLELAGGIDGAAAISVVGDFFSTTSTPCPVPEPATLLLSAAGLLAFGCVNFRQRRKEKINNSV